MLWQEEERDRQFQVPDDVVDLTFSIRCRSLPVDHLHALSSALLAHLPWLESEPGAGIHEVHLAGSQNGWERPDPQLGQELILSRRTRLAIRLPRDRVAQAQEKLHDIQLDIAGHQMRILTARERPLSALGTLFARHMPLEPDEIADEEAFVVRIAHELDSRGILIRKALCGRATSITTPDRDIATRTLLLAGLNADSSVQLQRQGLGPLRHMGCGIFLPHKGIEPVEAGPND